MSCCKVFGHLTPQGKCMLLWGNSLTTGTRGPTRVTPWPCREAGNIGDDCKAAFIQQQPSSPSRTKHPQAPHCQQRPQHKQAADFIAQKSSAPFRPLLKPPKASEIQLPPCHTAALAQASPPHCQQTCRAGAGARQGPALSIVISLLEPMVPMNVLQSLQGTSLLSSSKADQPPTTGQRAAVPLPPPPLPLPHPRRDGWHLDRPRVTGDRDTQGAAKSPAPAALLG